MKLQESAKNTASRPVKQQAKKTPRVLRSFAKARILAVKYQSPDICCTNAGESDTAEGQTLVPWMSLYNLSQASEGGASRFWGREVHE